MLPLRLNRRFFTLFAVLMLCMSFLTITASAEANPPKDDVIIYTADPTEPKPTEAAPKPTTPKPTTPPKTEPPATTAPTTPTAVKPVEPFTRTPISSSLPLKPAAGRFSTSSSTTMPLWMKKVSSSAPIS